MSDHNNWPIKFKWTLDKYEELIRPSKILPTVIEASNKFPIEFPVNSVRCKNLYQDYSVPEEVLERNVRSVYPVVHESALHLYSQFLIHKRKHGSDVEKSLYKDMNLVDLINRLLCKRAVCFVGPHDYFMKRDDGGFGDGGWEMIGTDKEKDPLLLKDYLSYDEIKLAALLSVSSYTKFINIGDRNNCGKYEIDRKKVEDQGVIVGLIGARLKKKNVMEFQDVVVTKKQNTEENGYGNVYSSIKKLFVNFYCEPCLTYDELMPQLSNELKFTKIKEGEYLNNLIYERRLVLSIDTLLIEANARAEKAGKMAYVHVVGFGLGVWKISSSQDKIFMDTFAKRLEFLSKILKNVSDICFAYIKCQYCGKYKEGDLVPVQDHKTKGIKIHIFNREPHSKLTGSDEGKLLIVSYAWDGNAFPGNEFWYGKLTSSGDPAAACSTQIAELHNPYINPVLVGKNLRIAVPYKGLLTIEEYKNVVQLENGNGL